MRVDIYTDGACSQAGASSGPGGWGMYIDDGSVAGMKKYGSALGTTNNIMELTAFVEALRFVNGRPYKTINIYTDSAYIVNCLKQGWYKNWRNNGWRNAKRQPVANKELWVELLGLWEFLTVATELNIVKVKGHSGNLGNSLADALAVQGKEEAKQL